MLYLFYYIELSHPVPFLHKVNSQTLKIDKHYKTKSDSNKKHM